MPRKYTYIREKLNVDYHRGFIEKKDLDEWYQKLDQLIPVHGVRSSTIFGDPSMTYTINYRGEVISRPINPWSNVPGLFELKNRVEQEIDQKITVCIIQRYKDGNTGIAPHRDKEMTFGTRICGISIGAMRTLSFTKADQKPLLLNLESGSMYVMNPPTNQSWLHSIVKNPEITKTRFSLTFRTYA